MGHAFNRYNIIADDMKYIKDSCQSLKKNLFEIHFQRFTEYCHHLLQDILDALEACHLKKYDVVSFIYVVYHVLFVLIYF